jgi:hypothetical protein
MVEGTARPSRLCRTALAALFGLAAAGTSAQPVTFVITGTAHKGEISDNLHGSATDPVPFEVTFTAEIEQAEVVPQGTVIRLPSAPEARFVETGYMLSAKSLDAFSLFFGSRRDIFSGTDVIADPETGAAIFLTGSLLKPTNVNLVLASAKSGYLEIGVPACDTSCRLEGGLVLDQAGPFGTLTVTRITTTPVR